MNQDLVLLLLVILILLSALRLRVRVGVRVRNRPLRQAFVVPPGSWKALFRFRAHVGTMNLRSHGVPASAGLATRSRLKAELHTNVGSWKAPSACLPCIGTMNREGAAGILPAGLCTDLSAGKMPAAL